MIELVNLDKRYLTIAIKGLSVKDKPYCVLQGGDEVAIFYPELEGNSALEKALECAREWRDNRDEATQVVQDGTVIEEFNI